MESMQYRKMLIQISRDMRENDLKAMKFMCAELIPKRRQEEINTAFELWEALEERDALGPSNLQFLRTLLESSTENRTDLLSTLNSYESSNGLGSGVPPNPIREESTDGLIDLSKEFDYLTHNLGNEWRHLARELGLSEVDIDCISHDYMRQLREQCYQSLCLWRQIKKHQATREELVHCLRKCQLNLFADNIEDM